MRRDNKRLSRNDTSKKGRTRRLNIRDKIRSQFRRLNKKQQCYVVEPSNEPEGEKKYIVVYESETEGGFGSGRIFKGTFRECQDLKNELNKGVKNERNT